jgi:hypothetical protein
MGCSSSGGLTLYQIIGERLIFSKHGEWAWIGWKNGLGKIAIKPTFGARWIG